MGKKKRLPVIIAFAAVLLIGILWVTMPVAVRLSCSLRIYCASAAAEEDAVDYVTYDNGRLVFANRESLQFLSKMVLEGELEDVTGCSLAPWPTPTYYIDDWQIGGNNCLSYHHFGRLYIITPKNYVAEEHFQELIDNAMMFFEDESGQILELQPCMADRVEILHETEDEAQDTTVTVTDEKIISELKAMYDTLQTQVTSRPMAEDRFVLTFYQGDRLIWTWRIAPWEDDGWVITSSSLEQGNYRVTNGFDFDRLAELSKGQRIEVRDGGVLLPYRISSVFITHIDFISMKPTQWAAEGEAVENLRDWLSKLECELLEVEEGQTPGGGGSREEYDFEFNLAEGDHPVLSPVLSYSVKGPDESYLLIDGNLYSVSNPSDPPVTGPQKENAVENSDDRLAELSKGQQIEARDGAVLLPYAVNTAGQTYGSALSARSHKERPDLISAVGNHGNVGYIYSSDLDAGEPITPSEALAQQTRIEELIEECDGEEIIVFRTIPLYDVDGITILDEYNISFTSINGF